MKTINKRKNIFLLRGILTRTFMLFMFCLRYTHIAGEKNLVLRVNLPHFVVSSGKKSVLIDFLV